MLLGETQSNHQTLPFMTSMMQDFDKTLLPDLPSLSTKSTINQVKILYISIK